MLTGCLTINGYTLIEIGLKGGYSFGSITAKEIHWIKTFTSHEDSTWTETATYTPTGKERETKNPKGFNGALVCKITLPIIPIGIEIGTGYSLTSYQEKDTTYTIRSAGIVILGKYRFRVPIVSPWIGIGPFLAFNKHKSSPYNVWKHGKSTFNFGISSSVGVDIGLIPKLSVDGGLLFNYYISSNTKCTSQGSSQEYRFYEFTKETKFSHSEIGFFLGMSYKIL
jgi:hypothetical protein